MSSRQIDREATDDCLLGYAHNGTVATCFMDSVLGAFAEDARRPKRRLTEYFPQGGPYIHENRALIARYFLECTDKQWLWMLDNDMDFPVDALYQLLEAAEEHDCKILGAAYWNQYGRSGCYLSWLLLVPHKGTVALPRLPDERDPVELSACGMGCTLIHRSVLEDVADMYPNDPWSTFGADILVTFADGGMQVARSPEDFGDLNGRQVLSYQRCGEDVTFALRARKAGYVSYGLPTLVVEHYKMTYMPHGRAQSEAELVGVGAIS